MRSRITLDEVDAVFPGLGLPPLQQEPDDVGSTIDDLIAGGPVPLVKRNAATTPAEQKRRSSALRRQLRATALSIRAGGAPKTVLHVLIMEDGATLGRIAAQLHADPRDVELELMSLIDAGWVVADASRRLAEYSLHGLTHHRS